MARRRRTAAILRRWRRRCHEWRRLGGDRFIGWPQQLTEQPPAIELSGREAHAGKFDHTRLARIEPGGFGINDNGIERQKRAAPIVLSIAPPYAPCGRSKNHAVGPAINARPTASRQCADQFVMDVAQADAQITARRLEIASAQLFVDRHHCKIGFRQRFRNVHHALGRMHPDQIEPMREVAARLLPGHLSARWRDRIAVENRKNEYDERVQQGPALRPCVRTQHAIDHFADHRKSQRKRLPAGVLDGSRKSFFGKENLGVMACAGTRIFVDSLLHKESRLRVDKVRKRLRGRESAGGGETTLRIASSQFYPADRSKVACASLFGICQVQ